MNSTDNKLSLPLTRRQFLKAGAVSLGVLACQGLPLPAFGQDMRLGYIKPVSTLEKAREIALKKGLKYVYLGNIPQHAAENTYCHNCSQLIIPRRGYMVGEMKLKEGKCAFCGTAIPGIWSPPKTA